MDYQKKPVDIKGWEMYQVDTDGNVYGQNGKILRYSINYRGYCIVNFNHNHKRKGFAVHTLVARTFIKNDDVSRTQVNHKNGIKTDNRVDNLEWVTPKENVRHSREVLGFDNSSANNTQSKPIKGFDKNTGELKYKFLSLADAARFFVQPGSNYRYIQNSISRVLNDTRKSYKNCVWKYDDVLEGHREQT